MTEQAKDSKIRILSVSEGIKRARGLIASLSRRNLKSDKNEKEDCETCKKIIDFIFGTQTTPVHLMEELRAQKLLHERPALLALPGVSDKQSENAETWSSIEENSIYIHYKYSTKVPEPLMCQDLEYLERKTLEHLTQGKADSKFEPIYEVQSVCAPKEESELDEIEIDYEAAKASALGGGMLYKKIKRTIPVNKYAPKIPEPLLYMNGPECYQDLENTGISYEVQSVCAPSNDVQKEIGMPIIESELTIGTSVPEEIKTGKHFDCMVAAYAYATKKPEPFLYMNGPDCFQDLKNNGNVTEDLSEPAVISYEVQSVCAPPDDVQKEIGMLIIKSELAIETSVVSEVIKTRKPFKCMIPAYENATKMPEPFLYINGPECFPEMINKDDSTNEDIEPRLINYELQSVCAPCKDEIQLEKKMRAIKGEAARMAVLCELSENKPKHKPFKCMIPAYEDATKIPEPFLYINGQECFQDFENTEKITGNDMESEGSTSETTVGAGETLKEIGMAKIKGGVVDVMSQEESKPAISENAKILFPKKYSKCIHEIQSVCYPSKDETKLEVQLSRIKGVATRMAQEESKPQRPFKCMIPAYEFNSKIPEPFLYINGPDDEELRNTKHNSKKQTKPGAITYEVQSVCATPAIDETKNEPLSVMLKRCRDRNMKS